MKLPADGRMRASPGASSPDLPRLYPAGSEVDSLSCQVERAKKNDLAHAESLFAEFLRLREDGKVVDFEDFCSRHPDQQMGLKVLQSIYERGQENTGQLDAGEQSIVQKLEGRFGDREVPTRSESSQPASSTTGEAADTPLSRFGPKNTDRKDSRGELARGGKGVILRV